MSNQNDKSCTVEVRPELPKKSKFVAYFGETVASRGYVQIPNIVWTRTDISAAEKVTWAILIGFLQGEKLRPLPANSPSNSLFSRFTGKTSRRSAPNSLNALKDLGLIAVNTNEMNQRLISLRPIECVINCAPPSKNGILNSAFVRRWGEKVASYDWIEYPKAILHDPALSDEAKLLYGLLLMELYRFNLKVCSQTSDYFAKISGSSRSSVARWIQELSQANLILVRGNPKRLIEINTKALEAYCNANPNLAKAKKDIPQIQCLENCAPLSNNETVAKIDPECVINCAHSVSFFDPIKDILKESEKKTDRQVIAEREWSELLWIVSRSPFLQKLRLQRSEVELLAMKLNGIDHALQFIDAVGLQALNAKTPIAKPALYFKTLTQAVIGQRFDYPSNYVHFRDRLRMEKEKILEAAKKAQPDLPWPKVLDELLLEAKEKNKTSKCFDETNDCIILLDTLKEARLTPIEIEGCFWFRDENILSPTIVARGVEYCRRKGTRINFGSEISISHLVLSSRRVNEQLGRVQEAFDLWNAGKEKIKNQISLRTFQNFIEPIISIGFSADQLQLRAESKFKVDYVTENLLNFVASSVKLPVQDISLQIISLGESKIPKKNEGCVIVA